MKIYDQNFDLYVFLKYARFSDKERAYFYKALKKKCFSLFGGIHIELWKDEKPLLSDLYTHLFEEEKSEANDSDGVGENLRNMSKIKLGFSGKRNRISSRIWNSGEEQKAGQIVTKKSQTLIEKIDYEGNIKEMLNKFEVNDETQQASLTKENCVLYGAQLFVGLLYKNFRNEMKYLTLVLSSPFKAFQTQRLFFTKTAEIVCKITNMWVVPNSHNL